MNQDEFLSLALRNPVNAAIADELFRLALPDAWIVSGCLVQTVWNALTNRAIDYGINDYDIFYFDPDTSWEAEDRIIRHLQNIFARLNVASKRAIRPAFISGIPKSTACPTRRSLVRRMVSTAFSPEIPASESGERLIATTSTRPMDLTMSPA